MGNQQEAKKVLGCLYFVFQEDFFIAHEFSHPLRSG